MQHLTKLSSAQGAERVFAMSSVFSSLAAGKGKVLGRVKNEEETPDVLPVHAQRKEFKLKILERRH